MNQVPHPSSDTSSTPSSGLFQANWTKSLIAVGMCALAGIGAWSRMNREEATKSMNELRTTVEEGNRQARIRFENGEDPYSQAQVDANLRAAKVAAQNATGTEAMVMNAAIAAAEKIAAAKKTILDARTPLEQAGGLAPETLQSKEDANARIQGMKAFGSANQALKGHVNLALAGMRDQLMEGGLSIAQADHAVSEFRRSARIDQQFELAGIVNEIVEASLVYLEVLHDQWGRWELSPADGTIVFANDAALKKFAAAAARIAAGAEAETKWQERAFANVPTGEN